MPTRTPGSWLNRLDCPALFACSTSVVAGALNTNGQDGVASTALAAEAHVEARSLPAARKNTTVHALQQAEMFDAKEQAATQIQSYARMRRVLRIAATNKVARQANLPLLPLPGEDGEDGKEHAVHTGEHDCSPTKSVARQPTLPQPSPHTECLNLSCQQRPHTLVLGGDDGPHEVHVSSGSSACMPGRDHCASVNVYFKSISGKTYAAEPTTVLRGEGEGDKMVLFMLNKGEFVFGYSGTVQEQVRLAQMSRRGNGQQRGHGEGHAEFRLKAGKQAGTLATDVGLDGDKRCGKRVVVAGEHIHRVTLEDMGFIEVLFKHDHVFASEQMKADPEWRALMVANPSVFRESHNKNRSWSLDVRNLIRGGTLRTCAVNITANFVTYMEATGAGCNLNSRLKGMQDVGAVDGMMQQSLRACEDICAQWCFAAVTKAELLCALIAHVQAAHPKLRFNTSSIPLVHDGTDSTDLQGEASDGSANKRKRCEGQAAATASVRQPDQPAAPQTKLQFEIGCSPHRHQDGSSDGVRSHRCDSMDAAVVTMADTTLTMQYDDQVKKLLQQRQDSLEAISALQLSMEAKEETEASLQNFIHEQKEELVKLQEQMKQDAMYTTDAANDKQLDRVVKAMHDEMSLLGKELASNVKAGLRENHNKKTAKMLQYAQSAGDHYGLSKAAFADLKKNVKDADDKYREVIVETQLAYIELKKMMEAVTSTVKGQELALVTLKTSVLQAQSTQQSMVEAGIQSYYLKHGQPVARPTSSFGSPSTSVGSAGALHAESMKKDLELMRLQAQLHAMQSAVQQPQPPPAAVQQQPPPPQPVSAQPQEQIGRIQAPPQVHPHRSGQEGTGHSQPDMQEFIKMLQTSGMAPGDIGKAVMQAMQPH